MMDGFKSGPGPHAWVMCRGCWAEAVLGSMSLKYRHMLKYRHLWYAFPFDTEKHLVMTPEK